ncbi:MAG: hypothetical protein QM778_20305 [Myxococcales bacterium]
MQSRLLRQSGILSLALGALVFAAAMPARAESPEQLKLKIDGVQAENMTGPVKSKTITLAADDERPERRYNRPLMVTGGAMLATGYIPAAVTAMANSKGTSGWLGVPVVGPWIDWGPHTSAGNKVLLFASGTLQTLGLAGIVTSFFIPESKTKKMPLMTKRKVHVSPVAGRGVYSLSAVGTF